MRSTKMTALFLAVAMFVPAAGAYAQVDFSGLWQYRHHEDQTERGPGALPGDFLQVPINDAARFRGDTADATLYALPEWQCRPHGSTNIWRSVHPVRIYNDTDSKTGLTTAIHVNFHDLIDRMIYLDGRPHPPEDAAHTWAGFSTGKWEGDMLTVETTHLKEYILRRNGLPLSDLVHMTEHLMRHGDVLTVVQIVYDPIFLTEPFIQSTDFQLDPHLEGDPPHLCEIEEESERPRDAVAHRLPGVSHDHEDYAKRFNIPVAATKGGAETMYPDYRKKMKQGGTQ